MVLINPELTEDIKKYGSFDFTACYNCGQCTAVCNLTETNANFPRMMVRYSILGLKEEILASKELWLCYACGDCSDSCPRQAAPANLMASLRRYAIANYETTGLTRLIFTNNPFSLVITLLLALILGFFLLTLQSGTMVSRWIFQFIPYEIIHNTGLIAFALMGISALTGVIRMAIRFAKKNKMEVIKGKRFFYRPFNAFGKVIQEAGTMKRYKNCDTADFSFWKDKPWFTQPWSIHWSIMWGFIGLLLATLLDFMFKDPAIPVWWPTRILGTATGILLVYGSSFSIYYRLKRITKIYTDTKLCDWLFLIFLWLAGITGFWIEVSVALDANNMLNQIVLIIHIIISMELVILFAFSKFAHAVYRPVALFIHYY